MRLALLSDIYANLEALEEAAADLPSRGVNRIAVLGDSIGYGANPNECLEWALQHADFVLMGNHEKAVLDPRLRTLFNPEARTAIEWTARILSPRFKKILPDLKYSRFDKEAAFSHGSLHEPEAFHYLMSYQDSLPSFSFMEAPVCFVGHTHLPCCFCRETETVERLKPGIHRLESEKFYICNPGSVGQPRDGDSRLAYGIYDDKDHTFEIVRLSYDNKKAAGKIRNAGLPAYLAERLL